jgi:hypothetical protein
VLGLLHRRQDSNRNQLAVIAAEKEKATTAKAEVASTIQKCEQRIEAERTKIAKAQEMLDAKVRMEVSNAEAPLERRIEVIDTEKDK